MESSKIRNVETWNKKELKKNVNKVARGVLFYEMIMFLIVFIDMIRRVVSYYIKENGQNVDLAIDEIGNKAINSGTASIMGVLVGILFLWFYFRKYDCRKMIFYSKEKMTGSAFLIILTIFMSAQALFSICSVGLEAGLNQFGYSILGDIASATNRSSTLSMLLYASFIGPITEEIVFRGYIMRGLQKYGSHYAIVLSAVIFGVFHGNLIQSIFAILVGLVLGYVAMKYSIKWAILLHIFNNFVFGDLFSYMMKHISESAQSVIVYIMQAIFLGGAILILVLRRNEVKRKMKEIILDRKMIELTFTSIWMLIFLTIQLLMGISGIERL